MKGFDAFAGVIKSGGKTRRAAKMVILNVDHPDIVEFVDSKMKEERKAHVLIEQGYNSSIDGEAYSSVFFQNANHSVRVSDEYMQAAEEDRDWWTRNVADGSPADKLRARELLQRISDSAWHCGDPGMQYDTTVNRWHTCKNTGRINASQSLLGVHVPGRHGLQPGVDQPAEVPGLQRRLRRRGLPQGRGRHHHRAGNPGGQRRISHAEDRREFAQLPPAGPGLRQSGRAADVPGAAVRFRRRARHGRCRHRADVRRGLRAVGAHRRATGAVPRLCRQSRADAGRDAHAPRFAARGAGRKTCSRRC